MIAALAGEDVLAAHETPVTVLDTTAPAPQATASGGTAEEGPRREGREGRPSHTRRHTRLHIANSPILCMQPMDPP
jgi:hypothetical protein